MSKAVEFKLVCACGCGTHSSPLGTDYVRITGNRKWYAEGCVPEDVEVIKEFYAGTLVKEEDF